MSQTAGPYPQELLESADALTQLVSDALDFDDTMQRLAVLAAHAVDGAEECSLSLLRSQGRLENIAATSADARRVDEIQAETGQGPCMSSIQEHQTFSIPDMHGDEKWLEFSKRAAQETEVRSVLSFVLRLPKGATGAMNLLSTRTGAFSDLDQDTGTLFAAQTAVVLANTLEHEDAETQAAQLQEALKTRQMIGQAVGIVMSSRRVGPEQAFEVLKRASQHSNIKLREIAERLVEKTQEPLN